MSTYEALRAAPVAAVMEWWLQQEIEESDAGPNLYLSKFKEGIAHFHLPFDDDRNFHSQKAKSHEQRITDWLRGYKQDPDSRTNDLFTAKIGFNTLMTISGSFRKQCMLLAASATEYARMRHEDGPTGVDIDEIVEAELATSIPQMDDLDPETRIDYIVGRTLTSTTIIMRRSRFLHEWVADNRRPAGQALAEPSSAPIEAMLEIQRVCVGLEVAQLGIAASFRDNDPARIPFLHPMNISANPGVIYPLAA